LGGNTFLERQDYFFILCLKQTFLDATKLGGPKKIEENCPGMPPVTAGMYCTRVAEPEP